MSDDSLDIPEVVPENVKVEEYVSETRAQKYQRWYDTWKQKTAPWYHDAPNLEWAAWFLGTILVFFVVLLPPIIYVVTPFITIFFRIIRLWWVFWLSMTGNWN